MKELCDLYDNDCRYPVNDGAPYLFCAEARQDGSSYCPEHHRICLCAVYEDRRDIEHPGYAAAIRKNLHPAVFVLMEKAE